MRELERLIARVDRYGINAAMLFVDLDGLKMINDTFGHRAGDEALIQVANLLAKGVRHSDVVARIGGDEFGILLEASDEDDAHETATRLVDQICSCEFTHDGDAMPLSVAIGVGMIDALDTAEAVMERADEAMYRAEGRGLSFIQIVAPDHRQIVGELVDDRLAGRDFEPDDLIVADVRQIFDDPAEAELPWAATRTRLPGCQSAAQSPARNKARRARSCP